MIAYNRQWLDNAALHQEVDQAYNEQCISAEEKARIKAAYFAGFYTPNPYIRIGLFLLTALAVTLSFVLLWVIFISAIEHAWRALMIFFTLGVYVALELFIRQKKHYRSGVDDGLLWMSAILIIAALNIDIDIPAWKHCALVFVVAAYCTLRFADMMMSALATLALLGTLFYFYLYIDAFYMARDTVPFIIIGASLLLYQLARHWSKNDELRHYHHCFTAAEITSLITLYMAGNYLIVRELSNPMLDFSLRPSQPIPGGWRFWALTVAIPIIYMLLGIQKKNIILLRAGILLSAASAYTIHHYYQIMSLEAVMTLSGLLLIALAYTLIRYLHSPKHGFTYHPLNRAHLFERLQAESLIITETFATPQTPTTSSSTLKFGGGTGGGAGADSSW